MCDAGLGDHVGLGAVQPVGGRARVQPHRPRPLAHHQPARRLVAEGGRAGPTAAAQLFAGIKSDQHEKYGWNNVIQQGLHKGLVERLDDVTLVDPDVRGLLDHGAEVLCVNLPAVALKSNQTIAATPVRIPATPGTAQLYGPLSTARTATATSSCEFAVDRAARALPPRPHRVQHLAAQRLFIDGVGERDLNWQKVFRAGCSPASRRRAAGAPSPTAGSRWCSPRCCRRPAAAAPHRRQRRRPARRRPLRRDRLESLTLYIDGTLPRRRRRSSPSRRSSSARRPASPRSAALLCAERVCDLRVAAAAATAGACPSEDFCAIPRRRRRRRRRRAAGGAGLAAAAELTTPRRRSRSAPGARARRHADERLVHPDPPRQGTRRAALTASTPVSTTTSTVSSSRSRRRRGSTGATTSPSRRASRCSPAAGTRSSSPRCDRRRTTAPARRWRRSTCTPMRRPSSSAGAASRSTRSGRPRRCR